MKFVMLILSFACVQTVRAEELCFEKNAQENLKEFRLDSFKIAIQNRLQAVDCYRLETGKSAVVKWDPFTSPSGVSHAYRLTKTGPKSFRSEIRLNLVPAPGEDVTPREIKKFRRAMVSCLHEYQAFMKGPDGETLSIELSEDPQVPVSEIKVTKKQARADAELYPLNMPCSVKIHEVLHLHGLCDEYKETSLKVHQGGQQGVTYKNDGNGKTAYTCRHEGPSDSIMNQHRDAILSVQTIDEWTYGVCETRLMGEFEAPNESELSKRLCPGSLLQMKIERYPAGIPFSPPENTPLVVPATIKRKTKTRDTLLRPGQFLAITRPGCQEENILYYRCAANAYRTKFDFANLPQGQVDGRKMEIPQELSCAETPPECKSPSWVEGPRK